MQFLTNIDLNKNSLLNAVIQPLASDPSSPVEGQVYENTADHTLRFYNGSAFLKLGFNAEGTARDNAFLLESVQGGETRGRYSIITRAPDLVWRCRDGVAEINRAALAHPDAFTPLAEKPLVEE